MAGGVVPLLGVYRRDSARVGLERMAPRPGRKPAGRPRSDAGSTRGPSRLFGSLGLRLRSPEFGDLRYKPRGSKATIWSEWLQGLTTSRRTSPLRPRFYLTESVYNVVLQKSIPPQIRQLIFYYD